MHFFYYENLVVINVRLHERSNNQILSYKGVIYYCILLNFSFKYYFNQYFCACIFMCAYIRSKSQHPVHSHFVLYFILFTYLIAYFSNLSLSLSLLPPTLSEAGPTTPSELAEQSVSSRKHFVQMCFRQLGHFHLHTQEVYWIRKEASFSYDKRKASFLIQ